MNLKPFPSIDVLKLKYRWDSFELKPTMTYTTCRDIHNMQVTLSNKSLKVIQESTESREVCMDNPGTLKIFTSNLTKLWPEITAYQGQVNTQANYDRPSLDISLEEHKEVIPLTTFLFGPKPTSRPLAGLEPISSDKIAHD